MRPINKKCVILSAEKAKYAKNSNKAFTTALENRLRDEKWSFKHLLGSYKGVVENSFLVEYENDLDLFELRDIARKNDQESILILDEDRNAKLHYVSTGLQQRLGKLRDISFNVAKELDAWSYCPVNDQYYGVL